MSVVAQGRERVAFVRQGWAHFGIVERAFEVEVGEGAETISVGRAVDGLAYGCGEAETEAGERSTRAIASKVDAEGGDILWW